MPHLAHIQRRFFTLATLAALSAPIALVGQTASTSSGAVETRAFHLPSTSALGENGANELQVMLRNMLDQHARIYLVAATDTVVVQSTPDQLALAERLVREAAQTTHSYKLTYTLVESDGGKRVGVQHYSMMVLANGMPTTMKQGSKVPVATGTVSRDPGVQTQFTYIDIGMNFSAAVGSSASGLYLKSKVEQSSVSEDKTIMGINEPVVRQSVLEGTAALVPGKPLALGSIDITGSTRHIDIEVIAEPTA